jgi:broad specificity phosphatase PhoE
MDEVKARFPGQFHARWHLEGAPGGESQAALAARASAALDAIVAAHPDDNVAVVSHGGTLNAALAHLLAIPPSRLILFRFENTSIARLRVTPERLDLISLGDTRHLDGFDELIT